MATAELVEIVVFTVELIVVPFNTFVQRHIADPLGGVSVHSHIAGFIRDRPPQSHSVVRVGMGEVLFQRSTDVLRVLGVSDGAIGVFPVVNTVDSTATPGGVGVAEFIVDVLIGGQSHVSSTSVVNSNGEVGGAKHGVGHDGLGISGPVITGIGVVPNHVSGPGQTIVGGFVHNDISLEVITVNHGNVVAVGSDVVSVS